MSENRAIAKRERSPLSVPHGASEVGTTCPGILGMSILHTREMPMPKIKIAIALDPEILTRLDEYVEESEFPSRSQAVQAAIEEKLARLERTRLARECAKLDPVLEKSLAEEGLSQDLAEWPAY